MARDNQKTRSRQLKEEILDTALTIALEEGFDALSIRKISTQMGYSTGIIYYHYQDKQEIIDAIQEREGEFLRSTVAAVIDPSASVARNLYAVFHAITEIAVEQRARYNLVVLQRHRHGEKERHGMLRMLCATLETAVRERQIEIADVERTAFAIWSSFLGFHLTLSQQTDIEMEEANRLFDIQYAILMKGIGIDVPKEL